MEPAVEEQVQAGGRNMAAVSMQWGLKVTCLYASAKGESRWRGEEVWGPVPGHANIRGQGGEEGPVKRTEKEQPVSRRRRTQGWELGARGRRNFGKEGMPAASGDPELPSELGTPY